VLPFVVAAPLFSQRLLDLPARTTASADALIIGASAILWNPAGVAQLAGTGEASVIDVRGPESIGIGAFAAAAAVRVARRTSIAIGFQHTGTEEIQRTGSTPLPEGGVSSFHIGEDLWAVGGAWQPVPSIALGANLRYTRTAIVVRDRSVVEFAGGFHFRPTIPFAPVFAAAAITQEDGTAWMAGMELTPYGGAGHNWSWRTSWGVARAPLQHRISHRAAGSASWRERITLSAGMQGEPSADGMTWQPAGAISVRINRYRLGVLREELPNSFGAFHSFHFAVSF
jgi:hypothetical protein